MSDDRFVLKGDPAPPTSATVTPGDYSNASWEQIAAWLTGPGDPSSLQTAAFTAQGIQNALASSMDQIKQVHDWSRQELSGRTSQAFEGALVGLHASIKAMYDALVDLPTGDGDLYTALLDMALVYAWGKAEAQRLIDFYAKQAALRFDADTTIDSKGVVHVDITTAAQPAAALLQQYLTNDLRAVMMQVGKVYAFRTSSLKQPQPPVQTPVSPQARTPGITSGPVGGPGPGSVGGAPGGVPPIQGTRGPRLAAGSTPSGVGAVPNFSALSASSGARTGLDTAIPTSADLGGAPSAGPAGDAVPPVVPLGALGASGLGGGSSPRASGASPGAPGLSTDLPSAAPLAIGGLAPRAGGRPAAGGSALGAPLSSGLTGAGGASGAGAEDMPFAVPLPPGVAAGTGTVTAAPSAPAPSGPAAGAGTGGVPFMPLGAGAGAAGGAAAARRAARGPAQVTFPGAGGGPALRPTQAASGAAAELEGVGRATAAAPRSAVASAGGGSGGVGGVPFAPLGGAGAAAAGSPRSRARGASDAQRFPGVVVDPTLRPVAPVPVGDPASEASTEDPSSPAPPPAAASTRPASGGPVPGEPSPPPLAAAPLTGAAPEPTADPPGGATAAGLPLPLGPLRPGRRGASRRPAQRPEDVPNPTSNAAPQAAPEAARPLGHVVPADPGPEGAPSAPVPDVIEFPDSADADPGSLIPDGGESR